MERLEPGGQVIGIADRIGPEFQQQIAAADLRRSVGHPVGHQQARIQRVPQFPGQGGRQRGQVQRQFFLCRLQRIAGQQRRHGQVKSSAGSFQGDRIVFSQPDQPPAPGQQVGRFSAVEPDDAEPFAQAGARRG